MINHVNNDDTRYSRLVISLSKLGHTWILNMQGSEEEERRESELHSDTLFPPNPNKTNLIISKFYYVSLLSVSWVAYMHYIYVVNAC